MPQLSGNYLTPGKRSENLVAGLLIAAVALLPFGRSIELPMAVLSLLGLYLLTPRRRIFSEERVRWYSFAFLCFLVPMLLALPDAVNLAKGATTTLGMLRYYLAGLAIIVLGGNHLEKLGPGVAIILVLWGLDAFLQLITGTNVLGYALTPGYTNSVFGEGENIGKLGFSVVLFLPVAVVWASRRWPWPATIAMGAFLVAVVLISGKRSCWLMAGMEILLLLGYFLSIGRIRLRSLALISLALLVGATLLLTTNDRIRMRGAVVIAAIENTTYETVDRALSGRLTIWETALTMGKDNWLNGVGPRGFRYAYSDYAAEGDRFNVQMEGNRGAKVHHSHQLLLEVFCETGVFGLAGLLALWGLLFARWRMMDAGARYGAVAFGATIFAWLFPVNTHPSIYSSWSAQLTWLMIALYFSVKAAGSRQ